MTFFPCCVWNLTQEQLSGYKWLGDVYHHHGQRHQDKDGVFSVLLISPATSAGDTTRSDISWVLGFSLVQSDHVIRILASHWARSDISWVLGKKIQ